MLATPATSVADALVKMRKWGRGDLVVAVERKYDGQRAAIHRTADGGIRLFSRKNDDVTDKFPDVVSNIAKKASAGLGRFALDAEVVPVDAAGAPLAFQELASRKRADVTEDNVAVRAATRSSSRRLRDCALFERS